MYHIRLIKGMSYSGAVTATRRHPDVFTENEAEYTSAMKSGYFEDLTGADEKAEPGKENPGEEDVKEPGKENPGEEDTFSDMNVDELKAYAERSNEKLKTDIFRAEQKVISITHNNFDSEELEKIPESVKIAVMILAEAYANNSIEKSKKQIRSETFDDYSYSLDSGIIDIDSLDLDYLLKDYMLEAGSGNVILRMTVI